MENNLTDNGIKILILGDNMSEEIYWTHEDFNKYGEYQEKKLKNFINSIK